MQDPAAEQFIQPAPASSPLLTASGPAAAWHMIKEALFRLVADEAIPLAGNIAFRTLFAMFPFLIFLTALAGFLGDEGLAQRLVDFLLEIAPAALVRPLVPEIRSVLTVPQSGLLSLGVLITVWSASGAVDSVRMGLNRAYDLRDPRSFLLLLAQNVLFVIVGAVALLALAVLVVLAPVGLAFVDRYLPGAQQIAALYDAWRYPVAILLVAVVLLVAHLVLPARPPRLIEVWPGIVLTLVVWMALAAAFSLYLGNFNTFASTYAGLGGAAAALFFLYLAALVLIFGGEINRVIRLRRLARERAATAETPDRVGAVQAAETPRPARRRRGRVKRARRKRRAGQ